MRLSLRLSVVLVVAAINVAVFGAGLAWLTDSLVTDSPRIDVEYSNTLASAIQTRLDPQGNINAPDILSWSLWSRFEDAIVVRLPAGSATVPSELGVYLNPLGSSHRSITFDEQQILEDIDSALVTGGPFTTVRGITVPVLDHTGALWGGCWFESDAVLTASGLLRQLLPWFLISTLLLTLGTFHALRRLVLDPVQVLANAARELEEGDLAVRVNETGRSDEVSELMRGFNQMASRVQGFGEKLANEVEIATAKAKSAEAAAMTQRRLAATGELAAGIAHEINNPHGGMINALEVLGREDLEPEKREQYLSLVKGGLERIHQTVGQVLRLAPRKTEPEPIGLTGPLGDALGLVRHRAESMGVGIYMQSDGASCDAYEVGALELFADLPPVMGESNELGQALLNLIVNSLDSLEKKPGTERNIEISMRAEGSDIHISFEDDGPGMDKEFLDRASDLFFSTKDVGKGTGLGLAIVHNVINGHSGRVFLSSEPGRGFRVDLYLPVAGEEVES